jgi:3-oxoacyl-[acyl-carrier protein] reductase
MAKELEGRRALVTGASRGIGREIARLCAEEGAQVAVHYGLNRAAAEATLAGLAGRGHALVQADLRDGAAAEALAAEAAAALGGLDLLVNNAGIYHEHPPLETDPDLFAEVFERILAVNLVAPARLVMGALPFLRAAGGGHVINIGSRGAYRGEPTAPGYAASKAGLHALGQALAKALAPEGIFVTSVAPGFVETEMAAAFLVGERGREVRSQSPLGRVARPGEVAEAVLFLASGRADFMTGAVLDLNGASHLR